MTKMNRKSGFGSSVFPVLVVLCVIVMVWYVSAVVLNLAWQKDVYERAENTDYSIVELVAGTMNQERPVLPTPHQVAQEVYKTTVQKKISSKRSLIFHSGITLSSALLGFALGTLLGIVLAIAIVYNRALNMSLMPWVIASQTIPILAVAPMIIVVLNAIGIQGLLPKAFISMYLSFFPVVVGMVKGLNSPDTSHTFSVCEYESRCCYSNGRCNRGRTAHWRSCWSRCKTTRWLLLWTNYPDLVGLGYGIGACGIVGGEYWFDR